MSLEAVNIWELLTGVEGERSDSRESSPEEGEKETALGKKKNVRRGT